MMSNYFASTCSYSQRKFNPVYRGSRPHIASWSRFNSPATTSPCNLVPRHSKRASKGLRLKDYYIQEEGACPEAIGAE